MANFQTLLKEAQDRFNLMKFNRIESQEKVDAFDTEMASIRGEVRLLDKLIREDEDKIKAKVEKKEEGENIPEQKEVRTE